MGGARGGLRKEESRAGTTGQGSSSKYLLPAGRPQFAPLYGRSRAALAAARPWGRAGLLEVLSKSQGGGAQAGSLCRLHWGCRVGPPPSVLHLKKQRRGEKSPVGLFCGLTQPLPTYPLALRNWPLSGPAPTSLPGRASAALLGGVPRPELIPARTGPRVRVGLAL